MGSSKHEASQWESSTCLRLGSCSELMWSLGTRRSEWNKKRRRQLRKRDEDNDQDRNGESGMRCNKLIQHNPHHKVDEADA